MKFSDKNVPTAEMTFEEEMAMSISIREAVTEKPTVQDEIAFEELLKKCSWWQDDVKDKTAQFKARLEKIASPQTDEFYKHEDQVSAGYKALFKKMDDAKEIPLPIPSYCYISLQIDKKLLHKEMADHYGRVHLPPEIIKENLADKITRKEILVFSQQGLQETVSKEKKGKTEYYCVDLSDSRNSFMECRNMVLKEIGTDPDDQKKVTILCDKTAHDIMKFERAKKLINPGLSQQADKFTYIYL